MIRLDAALKAIGSEIEPAEFRDVVQEVHAVLHPSWTVDELLVHPRDALAYCSVIRHRFRCEELSDDLILRTLLNIRRSGGREDGSAARSSLFGDLP